MRIKRAYLAGTVAAVAITGLAASASATPIFTIDPSVLGVTGKAPAQETDIGSDTSDGLIHLINGGHTAIETGWVRLTSFTPAPGFDGDYAETGLANSSGIPNSYGLYIKYTVTVTGLAGFGSPIVGNVSDFQYALYADIGDNDTFTRSALFTSTSTPNYTTAPTVGGGIGNDVVIAVGDSSNGNAALQNATQGPTLDTTSGFILCDGSGNPTGTLGNQTGVAASNSQGACGSFNGASYFTQPSPFYSFDFNSATAGSKNDLAGSTIDPTYADLHSVVVDINFIGKAPEPISISMFGAGLAGLAGFGGRRRKAALA